MILLILFYTGGVHGTPDFTLHRKKHTVLLILLYTGAHGTPILLYTGKSTWYS